jgi:branched-chain amino acid transport system substrate-binding protein
MFKETSRKLLKASVWMIAGLASLQWATMATAETKEPIKLGLVTWSEGATLTAGRQYTKGFELAIKMINEKGGILGRKVVGVIAPQGMTGQSAQDAATRLVLKDKVNALIGPHWTVGANAGLAVAKKYNLPYLCYQGGTWLYEQKYPGTAVFIANAYGRGNAQAKWAEKRNYKKVVIVGCDIEFNRDVVKTVSKRWEKPGSPKLLDVIWYTFGRTEVKQEITKAAGLQPDLIWSEEWSDPTSVFIIKQLKEMGYKGDILVTPEITKESLENLPTALTDGVFVLEEWVPDPSIPENKAFCDAGLKEWGELPHLNEENIWSLTTFILKSMEKAGTAGDGTMEGLMKISNAMHNTDWVSPFGGKPVRLSPGGLALWDRLAMAVIKNRKFEVTEYIPLVDSEWLPWLK